MPHDSMPDKQPERLCSEVQLFDLCDLDTCRYKKGRFCSDPFLLIRFEKIADDELRASERFIFEESDDSEEDEDDYDGDGFNGEDDRFEEDCSDGDEETGWLDEK